MNAEEIENVEKTCSCIGFSESSVGQRAQADTLTAGQTKTTALADWYANIYYTVVEGTYQVVITLAPGPQEGGRPMRVVHGLADGESQEISIGGFGKNTLLTTLKVSRAADQVFFNVGTRNVSVR